MARGTNSTRVCVEVDFLHFSCRREVVIGGRWFQGQNADLTSKNLRTAKFATRPKHTKVNGTSSILT